MSSRSNIPSYTPLEEQLANFDSTPMSETPSRRPMPSMRSLEMETPVRQPISQFKSSPLTSFTESKSLSEQSKMASRFTEEAQPMEGRHYSAKMRNSQKLSMTPKRLFDDEEEIMEDQREVERASSKLRRDEMSAKRTLRDDQREVERASLKLERDEMSARRSLSNLNVDDARRTLREDREELRYATQKLHSDKLRIQRMLEQDRENVQRASLSLMEDVNEVHRSTQVNSKRSLPKSLLPEDRVRPISSSSPIVPIPFSRSSHSLKSSRPMNEVDRILSDHGVEKLHTYALLDSVLIQCITPRGHRFDLIVPKEKFHGDDLDILQYKNGSSEMTEEVSRVDALHKNKDFKCIHVYGNGFLIVFCQHDGDVVLKEYRSDLLTNSGIIPVVMLNEGLNLDVIAKVEEFYNKTMTMMIDDDMAKFGTKLRQLTKILADTNDLYNFLVEQENFLRGQETPEILNQRRIQQGYMKMIINQPAFPFMETINNVVAEECGCTLNNDSILTVKDSEFRIKF